VTLGRSTGAQYKGGHGGKSATSPTDVAQNA
jgi:hypothetical protein